MRNVAICALLGGLVLIMSACSPGGTQAANQGDQQGAQAAPASPAQAGPYSYLSSAALDALTVKLGTGRDIKPTGRTRDFVLVARRAQWELAPSKAVDAVTYNGTVPGPTIRVTEGDTLRVTLKNELDQATTIHWHGLHVPNNMDGVPPFSQPAIAPGQTFTYEFIASHAGTFMYHPHVNSVEQIDNGLYGLLLIDPQKPDEPKFDKEFTMMPRRLEPDG